LFYRFSPLEEGEQLEEPKEDKESSTSTSTQQVKAEQQELKEDELPIKKPKIEDQTSTE